MDNSGSANRPLIHRLKSIDFLRGSAALAVIFAHAINYCHTPPTNVSWFHIVYIMGTLGRLGVPLFFVISGFCIHLQWAKQYAAAGKTQIQFLLFWKKRIHRLYPPYLVVVCFGIILAAIGIRDLQAPYPGPKPEWLTIDFISHVLMLHGFHPDLNRQGGNGALWTIAREEYFYILYFPLLAWRRRYGSIAALLCVSALGFIFPVLMAYLMPTDTPWWAVVNTSAIVLWSQWCLGLVAVEAHYGLVKLPSWCYSLYLVPLLVAVAFEFEKSTGNLIDRHYCTQFSPILYGLAFFIVVNWCARKEQKYLWFEHPFAIWLSGVGIFSYSLYLVHFPLQKLLADMLGSWAITSNPWRFLGIAIFLSIISYWAGWFYFRIVERRFLNTVPIFPDRHAQRPKVLSNLKPSSSL